MICRLCGMDTGSLPRGYALLCCAQMCPLMQAQKLDVAEEIDVEVEELERIWKLEAR
jgi:hypothetical protein